MGKLIRYVILISAISLLPSQTFSNDRKYITMFSAQVESNEDTLVLGIRSEASLLDVNSPLRLHFGTSIKQVDYKPDNNDFIGWDFYFGISADWDFTPFIEIGVDASELSASNKNRDSFGRTEDSRFDFHTAAGLKARLFDNILLSIYAKRYRWERQDLDDLEETMIGATVGMQFGYGRHHMRYTTRRF